MQQDAISAALIEACKKGNRKAQEEVYNRYARKMFAICKRYAVDTMEAEDILMVAFTKVFTKIDTYTGQGSFEGWVRTIVVNSALSTYQKNQRRVQTTSYDEYPLISEVLISEQKYEVDYLLNAMGALPIPYRQAFNLFALEGYSHSEIGKCLSISETLSKVRVSRARKMLQQSLAKITARLEKSSYAM